jgi:taurine--2-oxoglutarate transaminase
MSSFFYTWTAQSNAQTLDVAGTDGSFLILKTGARFDDFISTSFQTNFGHKNSKIMAAISAQLNQMPIAAPKWDFELKESVSAQLKRLLGFASGKIFYTTSGAEAVENALKIARQITGKTKILARNNSYHGATLGALSVTGDWRNKAHKTLNDWTVRIPEPMHDPNLEITEKVILQNDPATIAAFCLETISGTNGVIIPSQNWWDGIQALAKKYGILLIVDEVLVGFGRTGSDFAFQNFYIKPDMVTMSKGITGGYIPFGALWCHSRIADFYQDNVLACGLTQYAHPLGLAALGSVLEILKSIEFKNLQQENLKLIELYLTRLKRLETVSDVRVAGMLAAVDLRIPVNPAEFSKRNLFVFTKPNQVIIAPVLTCKPNDLISGLNRFCDAIVAHRISPKSLSL